MTILKRMGAGGARSGHGAGGGQVAQGAGGGQVAQGAGGGQVAQGAGGGQVAPHTIRFRTEERAGRGRRRWALVGAEGGLGAAGAIHLLWAAGSPWPTASRDELADLVVGARPFPSGPMTLGVVGLIGVGAALVARESTRLSSAAVSGDPTGAERGAARSATDRALRMAALGVPAVLGLRGLGGLVVSGFGLGSATPQFRHWDLRLYSPLCLLLGALAFDAIRNEAIRNEAIRKEEPPPRPTGRQSSEGF